MKAFLAVITTAILAVGCATPGGSNTDPYPGSGGLSLGTPSEADIQSGRAVFDDAKFSSFQIGVTTKQQVVAALGAPANWTARPDGTSQLGYNYVEKQPKLLRQVKEARFTFDRNHVLAEMRLPDYAEALPKPGDFGGAVAGSERYACKVIAAQRLLDDGKLGPYENPLRVGAHLTVDRATGHFIESSVPWFSAEKATTTLHTRGNLSNSFVATYALPLPKDGVLLTTLRIAEFAKGPDKPFLLTYGDQIYSGLCR